MELGGGFQEEFSEFVSNFKEAIKASNCLS
jgi:hypothetical protein